MPAALVPIIYYGRIATNLPEAPREFVTTFGLNHPGARIAMKLYVVLTTGNEVGGAAMLVQRAFRRAATGGVRI